MVGKIQIPQFLTTRQGVGSSPIDGQVHGTQNLRLMGRRPDGHRSGLRPSRVFRSVATMLVLPSPQESPVTDGNGSRDFFAATLYEAIPQAFVALDAESRFIYVNAKAGAILDREPASLL